MGTRARGVLAVLAVLSALAVCGVGCSSESGDAPDATAAADATEPSTALCAPCFTSSECQTLGDASARCVPHGNAGSFCGTGCNTDADCEGAYTCQSVVAAEGAASQQCVRKGQAACACSAWATSSIRSTSCIVSDSRARSGNAPCVGERWCASTGLTTCQVPSPTEWCDGVDNDCDGVTDPGCPAGPDDPDASGGDAGSLHSPDADATQFDPDAGTCLNTEDCDDGNPCVANFCSSGQCHAAPVTAPCDADGNECTVDDSCVSGSCVAGVLKACVDNDPCTSGSCQQGAGCVFSPSSGAECDLSSCQTGLCQSGTCANPAKNKPNGLKCIAGTGCTKNDACNNGVCTAGPVSDCDDGNTCTVDSCVKSKGCKNVMPAYMTGAACDDGSVCTVNDGCYQGACKGVSIGDIDCPCDDPCYACQCSAGSCVAWRGDGGEGCMPDDPCYLWGTCSPNISGVMVCLGSTPACSDGNPCTTDLCDSKTGACTFVAYTGPGACDDGDVCTTDACSLGSCAFTAYTGPSACSDGDMCTSDDACVAGKCAGKLNGKMDGTPCNDGKVCTSNVVCTGGVCKGTIKVGAVCFPKDPCVFKGTCTAAGTCVGPQIVCDDGNPCTLDACVASGDCTLTALPAATTCTSLACVTSAQCLDGVCVGTGDTCGVPVYEENFDCSVTGGAGWTANPSPSGPGAGGWRIAKASAGSLTGCAATMYVVAPSAPPKAKPFTGAWTSPLITLPKGMGSAVVFWSYEGSLIKAGHRTVLVSTDGFATSVTLHHAPTALGLPKWHQNALAIPLALGMAGKQVQIRFHMTAESDDSWLIDTLVVRPLSK